MCTLVATFVLLVLNSCQVKAAKDVVTEEEFTALKNEVKELKLELEAQKGESKL